MVKKNLRKSQAQIRQKLRKLRLEQNNDFLIKNVYSLQEVCTLIFFKDKSTEMLMKWKTNCALKLDIEECHTHTISRNYRQFSGFPDKLSERSWIVGDS